MKIHVSKTILVLAAALIIAPFANAQFKPKDEASLPPPSMIGLPGASRYGTDPLHLLQAEKVKTELKITDKQSVQLAKIAEKYDREAASKLGNAQGLSTQAVRETGDKLIESSRKEVSAVLNPDQLNRLKQILLQVNGAEALQDKEVAKQVGITAEESAKLDKLRMRDSGLHGSLGLARSNNSSDTPQMIAKAKIDDQSQNEYLGLMTAAQKQKLETLRGAPFTLEKSDLVGH